MNIITIRFLHEVVILTKLGKQRLPKCHLTHFVFQNLLQEVKSVISRITIFYAFPFLNHNPNQQKRSTNSKPWGKCASRKYL